MNFGAGSPCKEKHREAFSFSTSLQMQTRCRLLKRGVVRPQEDIFGVDLEKSNTLRASWQHCPLHSFFRITRDEMRSYQYLHSHPPHPRFPTPRQSPRLTYFGENSILCMTYCSKLQNNLLYGICHLDIQDSLAKSMSHD